MANRLHFETDTSLLISVCLTETVEHNRNYKTDFPKEIVLYHHYHAHLIVLEGTVLYHHYHAHLIVLAGAVLYHHYRALLIVFAFVANNGSTHVLIFDNDKASECY